MPNALKRPPASAAQESHDRAFYEVAVIVSNYAAGLITVRELSEKIWQAQVPDGVPGVIDRATGLRY